MLSITRHRVIWIATAALVAFANSVEAKSMATKPNRSMNTRTTNTRLNRSTTTKTKTLVWPHATTKVSSSDCYDK